MVRSRILLVACILTVAAAALAVRLVRLDQRPMHGDEANQAVKTGELQETGVYRYDPDEHHGPSLYYLTLPILWFSGSDTLAAASEVQFRLVTVLFGVGLILLLLLVADGLGPWPAVFAALLTAISPACVFYSRYYIQEMLLVFFTLAAIACGWRYVCRPSLVWAIGVGAALGLMHATKETWVLAAAAMVAGLGLTWLWTRRRQTPPAGKFRPLHLVAAVIAAVAVTVLFYSSFGTHWRGPLDSVLAYTTYARRAGEVGLHNHPWYFYLERLIAFRPARGFFWTEGLIVGLAIIGFGAAVLPRGIPDRQRPVALFLGFYTLTLTVLYAIISYKTPWCMLGFLHGMILLAGVGSWVLVTHIPTAALKVVAALLLIAATAHLGRQCYWLNFRLIADHRNPHVYAHTSSDTLNLAKHVEELAALSPEGHDMVIHVVTPDNYWPLPWYLRRFRRDHVGYWQDADTWWRDTREQPPPSVIMLSPDVQDIVDAHLHASYNKQRIVSLRPEVFLSVYVRQDLWDAFLLAQGQKSSKSTGVEP